jgi:hypothetical protein
MDKEYLELLKRDQKLGEEGRSLWSENEEESSIFLRYQGKIFKHFEWLNRKRYFDVINEFLSKKIDIQEYINTILSIEYETRRLGEYLISDFERLKIFEPISCPTVFSTSLSCLNSDCKNYVCKQISEEELIESTKRIFLIIKTNLS